MRAAILSIGDELTLGQSANSNAIWLAEQLVMCGVLPIEHRTVADDRQAITRAVADCTSRADVLLITGGLGPTRDDLTREALGDVLAPGEPLARDPAGLQHLASWFAKRGREMPESNLVQASRPRGTRLLPNSRGTAMGIAASHQGCLIFAMPGPPNEMQPMFREHVLPALREEASSESIVTAAVHELGLSEAAAAERISELMRRDRNPMVGTTASHSIVSARIRGRGNRDAMLGAVQALAARIEEAWRPYVFGRNGKTIASAVGELLKSAGETLATAESCTGGLLGAMLTETPGSSAYYLGGWITYSNELKQACLGVPERVLHEHGAVSPQVAGAMATGALRAAGATNALAITGIAGPEGGSAEKPVGTVYVALARASSATPLVRACRFPGEREQVRVRAALTALQMLRLPLIGAPDNTPLLWDAPRTAAATRA